MPVPEGTLLGPYEILGPLGSGGMGDVYRARDTRLGREVALKTLPSEMASDAERLSRFEKEARLASALNHPNIVTIHDIGISDSIHYIAMELVNGKTLRQLLAGGPLSLQLLVSIASQFADGLARAHEEGIVHRDLKPENVMITNDGLVKILDFGLSKHLVPKAQAADDSSTLIASVTNPGTILGTVDYMSPEQAEGKEVDFRSDHFSFGSIVYEMAAGTRPFHRDSAVRTMSAIIEHSPPPLTSINPETPEPLREIVDRCHAKSSENRWASTRDLASAVHAIATTYALEGARAATIIQPAPRGKRKVVRIALGAVIAVALLFVLAIVGMRPALPELKNVAVLPFHAAVERDQAFSDGLTEALTAKLTQLTTDRSLQVAPASEVRSRKVTSAEEAKRFFGSNLVLMGDLRRNGESLTLGWSLVDAATNRELRANTITVGANDGSAMAGRAIESVVDTLDLELKSSTRADLTASDTQSPAARELYLQARGYLQNYDRPENIDRAAAIFNEALKLDSGYAAAYAGLGDAYWRKYQSSKQPEAIDNGQKACEQALRLSETLAAAHGCVATFYDGTGRYEDAVKELQRALELEPTNDGFLRELARAQEKLGKPADAERTLRQAIAARPHYWANYNLLGSVYFNRGRYAEAAEMFKHVVDLAPDSPFGYGNLGGAYVHLGRYADAIPVFQRSADIRPTAAAYSNLATAYFGRRQFLESAQAYEEAAKLDVKNHVIWGNLGDARYWAPGRRTQAAEAYRKALALGEETLKVNPRDAALLGQLASYYAMLGAREPAMSLLQRALDAAPQDAGVRFKAALIHNQFKEVEQTLDWLKKAAEAGYSVTLIRDAPNFDSLWAYPRFQSLLRDH